MKKCIYFIFAFFVLGCETQSTDATFSDRQYSLIAYDQILTNYNIDQQRKDSLYNILLNTFSVSKHELDSLKSVLVEKGPFNPKLLERVKAEIDSINKSSSIFKINPL